MSRRSFGNDGNEGSVPKFDKSLTRMAQRGSYSKMRSHERLAGGADARSKSSVNVNASKSPIDTNPKVTPIASGTSKVAMEAEKEIDAILIPESSNHDAAESTGDKKVDEMIDYVIQNLQEAGKALASLGENFEHDLKLVFVDVMAKVQNWVGLAQLRLDAAKTDLKGLRKELISRSNDIATRDNEIAELKVKLAESEVAKNVYEKALTENVQRGGGPIPSPSTMTFVPSRQPLPAGASAHSANIAAADSQRIPGVAAASDYPVGSAGGVSAHSGVSSIHPGMAAGMISSQGIIPGGLSADPSAETAAGGAAASLHSAAAASRSVHPILADGTLPAPGEAAGIPGLTASAATLHYQQQIAAGGGIQPTQDQFSRIQQAQLASASSHPAGSSQPPGAILRSQIRPGEEGPVTADVAVQSGKVRDKEKGKRESELESELARLRKENEKIVKERADYENAIQRALLRGVSSLNVETLRVLRCPPVACYTPCGPPPSPVNTVEALVPCPPKNTRDNWTPTGCRTTASGPPRRASSRVRATLPEPEHGCCSKRPNTSSCALSSRNNKTSPGTSGNPSMVFLLPQSESPRVCVPTLNTSQNNNNNNRTCGRTKSRKLEASVCMRRVG